MIKTLIQLMIVAGMMASAGAQAIVIDGDLSDWGIQKDIGKAGWTPTANNGIIPNSNIQTSVEDWDRSTKNGYLDPGYGGQAYDAEALYALIEGNTLFIALATGHNPATANSPNNNNFGAGDFAIDFGKNGSYELGINIKPYWDTFGVAGGVYKNVTWELGLWNDNATSGYLKSEHPTSMSNGTQIGAVDSLFISSAKTGYGEWSTDKHYFYEMSINISLLEAAGWDGDPFNIHWTQNCANDSIIVDPPSGVPEPGTLALIPLGLLGLVVLRRRNATSAA